MGHVELDLPWTPKSPQEQGRAREKAILSDMGARAHPNSGAGSIKWDGSDDDYLYEIKEAAHSFTLSGKYLKSLFVQAIRQSKTPVLVVYFKKYGFTAHVTLVPGGKEIVE